MKFSRLFLCSFMETPYLCSATKPKNPRVPVEHRSPAHSLGGHFFCPTRTPSERGYKGGCLYPPSI